MSRRTMLTALAAVLALAVGPRPGPAMAAGARRALLVGIDAYPFVTSDAAQLRGAAQDLKQMRAVLEYCGFQVKELRGPAATRAQIGQSLQALGQEVDQGGQAVFYFSGRGSIAASPGHTEDAEPTLVPHDGKPGSAQSDVPMSAIEGWARQVASRGATPVVVLDACYQRLGTRGEDRFYKNVPRCVGREGSARKQLYAGPGIVLAATDSRGSAYEWRVDFNTNTWAGAFTDELTNTAMGLLRRGQAPTFADLMDQVRRLFAARPGYMPGLRPWPAQEALTGAYAQPAFGAAATASASQPPGAAAAVVASVNDANRQKGRALRVGLDTPKELTGAARTALLGSVGKDVSAYLSAHPCGVELVPQYGDRPDRLVVVRRTPAGLRADVVGNLVDAFRKPTYEAQDVSGVMSSGLADYLERQACALRLFRLADDGTPTDRPGWRVTPEKVRLKPGDAFAFTVEAPGDGLVYLLEQDDASGLVQLVWPAPQDPDNAVHAGTVKLPHTVFEVNPDSPEGKSLVRALVVLPRAGADLPPLKREGGASWVSADGKVDPAYAAAELRHLRAVVEAVASGKADWLVVPFTYETGR